MSKIEKIKKLEDLIKDTIGGKVLEQTVESLLPPGENYGSVIYKVDFKVKKENKVEEFHAVAKCTPLNTICQDLFNTQETFKTEIAWYTTVIPTLKQFQKDHGVKEQIDFFQKFYGARISLDPTSEKVDLDGVILTENLKYSGFQNIDRHIGFDEPTTFAILRDLATFHAVPLAIRIQKPELFDKNIKPYLSFLNINAKIQQEMKRITLSVFDHLPECEPIMGRMRNSFENAVIFSARPVREPWVTVTHSDFWINNVMVSKEKNIKTIILDLQSPSIGSPVDDLLLFLLSSVKLDVIREKFDDFVRFYYEQFCKNLKELKVSTEKFTFKGLLEEIEIQLKSGELAHSLNHSRLVLETKGTSKLDSSDANYKIENLKIYKLTVNERQIEKLRWLAFEAEKRKWI